MVVLKGFLELSILLAVNKLGIVLGCLAGNLELRNSLTYDKLTSIHNRYNYRKENEEDVSNCCNGVITEPYLDLCGLK